MVLWSTLLRARKSFVLASSFCTASAVSATFRCKETDFSSTDFSSSSLCLRFGAPMSSTGFGIGKSSCARIGRATTTNFSAAAAIAASMLGEDESSSSSSFAEAAAIAASTSLSTTFGGCRSSRPASSTVDSRSVCRLAPTPSSFRRTDILPAHYRSQREVVLLVVRVRGLHTHVSVRASVQGGRSLESLQEFFLTPPHPETHTHVSTQCLR